MVLPLRPTIDNVAVTASLSTTVDISSKKNRKDNAARGVTGACVVHSYIKGITGCTCTISDGTVCTGVFYAGMTCAQIIGNLGACCLQDRENNTILPCQKTTYCSCYSLADSFNFEYKWNPFTTDKPTCADFSCDNTINLIGACCDGIGNCYEITEEECNKSNHFFQGPGTRCISNGVNLCTSGTGGCCDGITCIDGSTGTDCIPSGRIYLGNNKRCFEFSTHAVDLPCYSSAVPGRQLQIGDLVEGGVVAGIYSKNSNCLGNPIFTGGYPFADLINGSGTTCSEYITKYDYNGYGVISPNICDDFDSYILIVSLDSLVYNEIDTFTWGNGSMSYGPLISPSGRVIEQETQSIKNIQEGYIYNSQLTEETNERIIHENSTSRCFAKREGEDTAIQRSFRNNEQHFNGRWSSDWGLINTIRLTNAEIMYESGITFDANMYSSMYTPSVDFDTSMTSMIKALRRLNRKTKSEYNTSSWYIPSINELAHLAYQCKNNSLNTLILNNNGVPIRGEFWSSTGTFNYTGSTGAEGIYNGATASFGSYAWSLDFSEDGEYIIKKDSRLINKNVRPIRKIRCDGNPMTTNQLFWKVNS